MTAEVRRDFLGDVKWLGLVQVALRAKGLVVLPFLTRELGVLDYGVWSQLAIVTAFVGPFISWGTTFGFLRRKSGKSLEERRRFFSAWIYALFAAFALVFAIVMAVAAPLAGYLLRSPDQGTALIAFAVLYAFTGALLNAEINWLRVNGESRAHALSLLAQAVLSLAAVVTYLIVGGSVLFLAALTVAADALLVAGLYARHVGLLGWARADYAAFWQAFRYGLPLMPMAFADIGINWIDRLVLLKYVSIAEIGIYNLVHGMSLMIIQTVTQPFWAYYPPRATAYFNAGKTKELRTLYGLSAGTLFAIQVPSAIGIFFVAPPFLAIMAPPEFAAGAAVLPLLFLGFAISRQGLYIQQVLEWHYRQHWVTISLYGCFALNVLFNFLLVPKLGLVGAGISNIAAFTARYIFIVALIWDKSPVHANVGFVVRILAGGAFMAVIMWLLPAAFDQFHSWGPVIQFLISVAVGSAAYVTALGAFGVVQPGRVFSFARRAI